jgi:hypothetical protein
MVLLIGLLDGIYLLIHYLSQSESLLFNLFLLKSLDKLLLLLDLLILLKQGLFIIFNNVLFGLDLFMLNSAGVVHVWFHFLELLFLIN